MTVSPYIEVPEALERIRRGEIVLVTDDATREHETDLIVAATHANRDAINFLITHGRGLVCVALPRERLLQLQLSPMVPPELSTERHGTAFTVSVDAREGTSTGISAADRAHTIKMLMDLGARPQDFLRPGHVFPLTADPRGVLGRPGHTEAALELTHLAGLPPGGVICELLDGEGNAMRGDDVMAFAREHRLGLLTIQQLIDFRWQHDTLVERGATAALPTEFGEFLVTDFRLSIDGSEHVALLYGDISARHVVLTRIHSECLTGDALHSLRCDCGDQLHLAMEAIVREGAGVLLYLRQEGRGIGLAAKLQAYALQDQGFDTVEANLALGFPADQRHYGIAVQVLRALGISRVRLLTNNPDKMMALAHYGIVVEERLPLVAPYRPERARYLLAKRMRLAHELPEVVTQADPSAVVDEQKEPLNASCL
ncbi:MAG: GTP cyclohydrolase II [Chloroflexi bacterium]|nr:GTP cyclohydrolase II [Chloroflexota bacterium]